MQTYPHRLPTGQISTVTFSQSHGATSGFDLSARRVVSLLNRLMIVKTYKTILPSFTLPPPLTHSPVSFSSRVSTSPALASNEVSPIKIKIAASLCFVFNLLNQFLIEGKKNKQFRITVFCKCLNNKQQNTSETFHLLTLCKSGVVKN